MDENLKSCKVLQVQQCARNLENHNFGVTIVENAEDALQYLKEHIPPGSSIGVGGSVTLNEIGAIEWLTGNEDYNFLDRYHTDNVKQVFRDSLSADVYLTSSNAVTIDGRLYNVDSNGNRVAALIYGPDKVYVICGMNKIVANLNEAITRVQYTAAPANNIRLKRGNPCEKIGSCVECNNATSICNQFVVTRRSVVKDRIHVILVCENLGY